MIGIKGFLFTPAAAGEAIVHGGQRSGCGTEKVGLEPVREWISFMKENGIRRVCCLLPAKQLAYYTVNLVEEYGHFFHASNVCPAEVEDSHLSGRYVLEAVSMRFLVESDEAGAPVVVHRSGGSGRTGHVLAAWLVRHRGLNVEEALAAVEATGRDPCEAVRYGYATESQLRELLRGPAEAGF